MKRYQALADEFARSIQASLLKPGDRLPSVREASASHSVSPATVFEAYYLLEARGLVRSRPRSGFFVAATPTLYPPEAVADSRPDGVPCRVSVDEMVFDILESAAHRDIVPLGSAFPSPFLFPLEKLGRMLASAGSALDPWSTVDDLTRGSLALRRQIALRYMIDGLQVDVDAIVVTNGAMEALNLCLSATCEPGDAVLVESPCFYACLQAIEHHGLRAIEVATNAREGIDLAALEGAIRRHAPKACWLMTNYQNPLGSCLTPERKKALVEMLATHRVPLIEDDVYGELHFGQDRPVLAKSYDAGGWVMHCSSFSKTLAPGYRVGWVAPGRFLQQVARRKVNTSISTCLPAQLAIARYLEKGAFDRHLRHLRKELANNRDLYLASVGRHFPEGTCVSRPSGGYFLWLQTPGAMDALALQRRAMSAGISVAPGPMFAAHPAFENCLRVNFGHPFESRVDAAIATLGEFARSF